MSKHDARFIMREMSFAQGIDFQTIYWMKEKVPLESALDTGGLELIVE